jgi:hypothetical protein
MVKIEEEDLIKSINQLPKDLKEEKEYTDTS